LFDPSNKTCFTNCHLPFAMDMKAMIRKAIPARNQLPVRNQTTMAMIAAGRKKSKTLATTMIMIRPIISRIRSAMISKRKGMPSGIGTGGAIVQVLGEVTLGSLRYLSLKTLDYSKEFVDVFGWEMCPEALFLGP